MNQGSTSTPWLLIAGLLLGAGLLGYMAWDSFGPGATKGDQTPGSSQVVVLTAANWDKEVVESKIPVLVDFTATWCPPCKKLAPTIAALAEKYQGQVKVAKFDVGDGEFDKLQPLAKRYSHIKMRGVPTVMLFKGSGPPVWSQVGAAPEAIYVQAIETVITER